MPEAGVPAERLPFVSVLCVGEMLPGRLLEALRRDGIGVICSGSHGRGVQVLRHFQASAVVCADPTFAAAIAFSPAPVILLAPADAAPCIPGVTVVNRHTDPDTVVHLIRKLATNPADRPVVQG